MRRHRWLMVMMLTLLALAACGERQLARSVDTWCRNNPDCDHADDPR